jgi:hypothetical protein
MKNITDDVFSGSVRRQLKMLDREFKKKSVNSAEISKRVNRFFHSTAEVNEAIRDALVRPVLESILELAKKRAVDPLYTDKLFKILSAPTGVGKTYALYEFFITAIQALSKSSVIFILVPENSIISFEEHSQVEDKGIATLSEEEILKMNVETLEQRLNKKENKILKAAGRTADELDLHNVKSALKTLDRRRRGRNKKCLVILTSFKNFTYGRRRVREGRNGNPDVFSGKAKGQVVIDYLNRNNLNFGIIVDEAHISSTSGAENYAEDRGLVPSKYYACLSGILADVIQYNPYVYGMSATLTSEQKGTLSTVENDNGNCIEFSQVNKDMFTKEMIISRTAWVGPFNYFDPSLCNENEFLEKLYTFLDLYSVNREFLENIEEEFQGEGTRIIRALVVTRQAAKNTTERTNPGETLWAMKKFAEYEIDNGWGDRKSMYIMNGHYKMWLTPNQVMGIIDYETDLTEYMKTQSKEYRDIIDEFNDDNNPEPKYLFVIGIGSVGMDIPSLKYTVDLRPADKDKGSQIVTDSVEQRWGRMARLNVGYNLKLDEDELHSNALKFLENGYDLTDSIRDMTEDEWEVLKITNTAHILAPANATYQGGGKNNSEGVESKIRKKFASIEDAEELKNELWSNR